MKTNIKSEKGAITLIALVTMLFLISFLMSLYIRISNKAQISVETTAEIAKKYNNIGDADVIYDSYFGTEEVIPITSKEELMQVGSGKNVEVKGKIYTYEEDGYYTIQNDIDLEGNEEILTIIPDEFSGTIDGLGNTIKGIYTEDKIEVLFNIIQGSIKNLNIEGKVFENNITLGRDHGENITYRINGEGTAIIPKGFIASGKKNEMSIENGLVIKDDDGNEDDDRNEFVWIPVKDINDMIMCRNCGALAGHLVLGNNGELYCTNCEGTLLAGRLYALQDAENFNFSIENQKFISTSILREPTILKNATYGDVNTTKTARGVNQLKTVVGITGSTNDEVISNWTNLIEGSFSEMANSVAKNGGFYVGRYETSLDSNKNAKSKYNQNTALLDNWYSLYVKQKTYALATMGVKSDMIWGCQYDQIMKFINGKLDGNGNTFNVTSYGGRNPNTNLNTGMNLADKVSNIYDLESGMAEVTQEALYADGNDIVSRIVRGGSTVITNYLSNSASYRGNTAAYSSTNYKSSRITLYIK